jgi:hypothetical protein
VDLLCVCVLRTVKFRFSLTSMAAPLTAEALKADMKILLEMRDEVIITEKEFLKLEQEAIARFQRPPAGDPNAP